MDSFNLQHWMRTVTVNPRCRSARILRAGSGGILPPVSTASKDARRTRSQGWLRYARFTDSDLKF